MKAENVQVIFRCPNCNKFNIKQLQEIVGHEVKEDYAKDVVSVVIEFECVECCELNEIKVFPLF